MSSAIAGIVATTVPLLALGFISHARWRLPLAAVAVAVAFAVAGSKGIVMLEDLWVLPLGIGMTDQLILLLLWCLLGSAARAVGPLTVPGPVWLTPMLMGAGMGEVPAAVMLSATAKTPKGAARLALTAAAGALVGRLGDLRCWCCSGASDGLAGHRPLGLALVVLVRPRSEDVHAWDGRVSVQHAALLAVILAAMVPGVTLWAILVGIGLFVYWSREGQRPLDWPRRPGRWRPWCSPSSPLEAALRSRLQSVWRSPRASRGLGRARPRRAMAVLAALTDGLAMAVFAQGVIDRAMSLDAHVLAAPMAVGAAVGGLGPLVLRAR